MSALRRQTGCESCSQKSDFDRVAGPLTLQNDCDIVLQLLKLTENRLKTAKNDLNHQTWSEKPKNDRNRLKSLFLGGEFV